VTRLGPAGLVAAYRFNEGAGTTTADAIDGEIATLAGGVTRVNGFTGGGLAFDGATDRGRFASDLNQWLGTTASLAFRIRTTQTGNDSVALAPGLLGSSSSGDANDAYWGWLDGSGRIGVQTGDAAGATSADPINDNLWHHIVLTRDAATGVVEVYADGSPSGSATGDTGAKTAPLAMLGRIAHPGGSPAFFGGVLDDLAVFDRVLTADEVLSLS
jgi:hypothetical protein